MLEHRQFENIMDRVNLTVVDLMLLEDHLNYIGKVYDEYGDSMPSDVECNLMGDVENIIARLQVEYKKLTDKRLTKG